ncbi:MAG: c-type cytochrome domain-containing protein, partial [Verrucomicrobiota bacterium]
MSGITCLTIAIFLSGAVSLFAAVDVSELPPPAQTKIDFAQDIRPIFESSCLRCHGPEKPKSHFRLTSREAALKGGDNGIDIIPGDSAKSPLIHFVSHLVEEMVMPPPGKGDDLTPQQIGLLRAWIDQGANWFEAAVPSRVQFSVAPTFRYFIVSGDRNKFREIEGHREGSSGGAENFFLKEQIASDTSGTTEGHALLGDEDYALKLSLDKNDTGFIRAGVEQWRKYYDDSGVFYPQPFIPSLISLDRDLHLDLGRAWIDFGLTRPHWPQIVLGYEYQWKEGAKSTLEFGDVNGKNIFPATKKIDEQTHILKFDLVHELYDWRIEDNARVEIFDSSTRRNDGQQAFGLRPVSTAQIDEKFQHVQGVNTVRLERQLGDWLFLAGGYFYSRLEG